MNYKKEYQRTKTKLDLIKLIGLAIVYASVFVYWVVRQEENMELIKEILFWWMLLDNIALCISKTWRKFKIEELSKMEK